MKRMMMAAAVMSMLLMSACAKKEDKPVVQETTAAVETHAEVERGTISRNASTDTGSRVFVPSEYNNKSENAKSQNTNGRTKVKVGIQSINNPAGKDEWFEVQDETGIYYMKITDIKLKGCETALEKFNEGVPEKEQIKVVPEESRDITRNIMFQFEYYYPSSRNQGKTKNVFVPEMMVFSSGSSKTDAFLVKAKMDTAKKSIKTDKILKGTCYSTANVFEDGLETKIVVGVKYGQEYTYAKLQ